MSPRQAPRQYDPRGDRPRGSRGPLAVAVTIGAAVLAAAFTVGATGAPPTETPQAAPVVAGGEAPTDEQPAAGVRAPQPVVVDDEPVVPNERTTVVSLTFDDGTANQLNAVQVLDRWDVDGTFYVSSGLVDRPGYLARSNLDVMAASGHEIGGHTATHASLTDIPLDEATRQLCTDRERLVGWGFPARSLAYPFANLNDDVKAAAESCGYTSARSLGDLRSRDSCADCDATASFEPADPYELAAPSQVESWWDLDDLQSLVTDAEAVGGWVPITFHNVCDGDCALNVSPQVLEQFTGWLAAREATHGTLVRTVGEVLGGESRPAASGPAPNDPGPAGVTNAGFEEGEGSPRCWMASSYGDNTAEHTSVPGRDGGRAAKVEVTEYVNGDAKWMPELDLGHCTRAAAPGEEFEVSTWYQSDTSAQFSVYRRDDRGAWKYVTSSPYVPASAAWAQTSWKVPAMPDNTQGVAVALVLTSEGSLTVDDVTLTER